MPSTSSSRGWRIFKKRDFKLFLFDDSQTSNIIPSCCCYCLPANIISWLIWNNVKFTCFCVCVWVESSKILRLLKASPLKSDIFLVSLIFAEIRKKRTKTKNWLCFEREKKNCDDRLEAAGWVYKERRSFNWITTTIKRTWNRKTKNYRDSKKKWWRKY